MSTDPTPTSRAAEDHVTPCPQCNHGIKWHHDERGCDYLGPTRDKGCPCALSIDAAIAELLREQEPAQGGLTEAADCTCGWGGVHDPDNPRCAAYAAGLAARGGTTEACDEVSCDDCGHLAQRHWRPGGCHGTQGSNASKCRCNKGRVE